MTVVPPFAKLSHSTAVALATLGLACNPKATTVSPADDALGNVHADARFTARMRIFDAEGRERTLPSVLDELGAADVVFFGETHTDDMTHQLEHAVFTGLAERNAKGQCLSLEMFERDVQPIVDAYLDGTIDEDAFVAQARPWPNYRTGYRPLVLAAKQHKAPVVAANTPRPLLREVGGRDAAAFAKAKAAHPDTLPAEIFPPTEAYQARVNKALRGHGPGMGGGDATWSVQNFWDNTMADSVAKARDRWPERSVVHYAGGFHIAEHDGTVAQFAKRRPKDVVKTIMAVPTFDLASVEPDPKLADFVAYVRADAQGLRNGSLSVAVPAALDWRISIPEDHHADDLHPLVVILADQHEPPGNALRRWRARLSDKAVVAVVVPPHRQESELGWIERRWTFPGSFGSDVSPVVAGLPRLIDYARRRLPVTEDDVTLVGEGTGGAVALWAALYGDQLAADVVAINPALPHALQKAALPDKASVVKSLTVVLEGQHSEQLERVLDGLAQVGVAARRVTLPIDSTTLERDRSAVVASAIGVPQSVSTGAPRVLVVGGLTPHGRAWAGAIAAKWEQAGTPTTLAQSSQAADAVVLSTGSPQASIWVATTLKDTALPRPQASFGGGTIVVIPQGMPDRVKAAWAATVEASKEARGRFAPIRLVTEGSGQLRDAALSIQEAGWSDIVVVPAVFAAHPALMRRLRDGATDLPADLVVQWLPGFGGAVANATRAPLDSAAAAK